MMFDRIKMIQIDYFIAVATHLSFSKAAKSLYISQPSLSKQVAQLETEIGVQLLKRTKRSVSLTPAGMSLYKDLKDIKQRLNHALEKSKQTGLGESRPITVGCLDAMNTSLFLNQMIESFKADNPNAQIMLERHSFKALREKLLDGILDLIFTLSFEIDEAMGVHSKIVYETPGCIALSSSHPLAKRQSLTIKDLKNESFVLISRDESPKSFDSVISTCKKHGFTPNIVKQLPNVESLLLSVESGMGVTLFDSSIRIYHQNNFKLFEIEDDFVNIVMAWRSDNPDAAVHRFAEM